MKSKRKNKIKSLSTWEWMTLVAAWRYYEGRSTISAATFPEDLIMRYWGSGKYDDAVLTRIAHQFAEIDHGINGVLCGVGGDTYIRPWHKLLAFCQGWCKGFSTVVLDRDYNSGRHVHKECKCFFCESTGRWYSVDNYVKSPHRELWCAKEFITNVIPNGVKGDKGKRK